MSILDLFRQSRAVSQRKREAANLIQQLAENEKADRAGFPEEYGKWKPFLTILNGTLERYAEMDADKPVDATIKFFITEDRMAAYACILPPLNGGKGLSPEEYSIELGKSGITSCINEGLALGFLERRDYLHIFPIAKGIPSRDGTDGRVEELFEPRPVFRTEGQGGEPVDFSELRPVQLIRKGETVCNVFPATKGQEGIDVTGNRLPCRDGIPVEVMAGHNMEISEDSLRIVATENGGVFQKDGATYVQTAIVRRGDLKADDDLVWLAYIDGDIPEGINVVSTSNVVVMGEIRGAVVRSKGCVRAQGGIRKGSRIEAERQVLAPVIEDSYVRAGRDIYAGEIRKSDVVSGGNVYVTGGSGVIQGGIVHAIGNIECLEITGGAKFVLGFSQDLNEKIERLSVVKDEVQGSIDVLRKKILNLRKGGESLPLEKRKLLSQLVEQKEQYEELSTEIGAQLKEAKEKRRTGLDSELICKKMEPPVEVQIGEHTGRFAFPETQCRFHLYAGQVMSH